MGKYTAAGIAAETKPGSYVDGKGLMLVVGKSGSRSWILRTSVQGKRKDIGLGSASDISLKQARESADDMRALIRSGIDPVAERQKAKARAAIPTFAQVAEQAHSEYQAGWKNGKHVDQWINTLSTYAFPVIGKIPVNEIERHHVRDAFIHIWQDKPETARRVRQRIIAVLDWAVGKGYRENELTIRSINRGLPKQKRKAKHHAAARWQDVRKLYAQISAKDSAGSMALRTAILTGARSGEVRGATWAEIDLEAALWTIPAERMKAGVEHRIPLSAQAISLFKAMQVRRYACSELVFSGRDPRKPLSDMTLLKVLRDMELSITVHGFRSCLRDWIAENTRTPRDVAEACLAHAVGTVTELSYKRTDYLADRIPLMQRWADHVEPPEGAVVAFPIQSAALPSKQAHSA
jgi:integrase